MPTLATLLFATPFFGFALTPPTGVAPSPPPGSLLRVPVFAQVASAEGDAEGEAVPDEDAEDEAADEEADEEADEDDDGATDMQAYAAQLRERSEIATVHRAFGIATWGAMLVTGVLGFIQYYNLYGVTGNREDTPCVQGNAVFGQEQCWGVPWPHRVSWITSTALYATTFTLSFMMPDPNDASSGNTAFAERLRIHKALRWAHFAGMILQVFLGLATAQNWFGIDRANDFDAQRALATTHQVIGWTTIGLVTASGAIMIF